MEVSPRPAGDRLKFIDQVEKQLKAQKAGSKGVGVGGAGNTNDDDTHPSRSVRRGLGGGLGDSFRGTSGRAMEATLEALKSWTLFKLDAKNAAKSKADSQRLQGEIAAKIEAKAAWVVDQWIDYDFLTYATVTIDTTIKWHGHAMTPQFSNHPEYIGAQLVSADVGRKDIDTTSSTVLDKGTATGGPWSVVKERETVSWLIPEDAEALRARLEERIAIVEELMIKEPHSGSLTLAKDHLLRRLELVGR